MDDITMWMQTLLGGAWKLMSKVTVPGFGISAAKFAIGFFVINWSLNLLSLVTGFRTNTASTAEGLRSGRESAHHYKEKYTQYKNEVQRRNASLRK